MASIVRSSKFRHVFGTAAKREDSYENLRVGVSAWDSNFVAANPKYLSVNWAAGGGGAFCVIPHEVTGKLRGDFPIFSAHQGAVLDTAFSPFDDDVIASGAEDHQAMVWRVPQDLLEREEDVTEPVAVLRGHGRKVGHVAWNPVAANVLAASSSDNTVRIWDVEQTQVQQTLAGFGDSVMSIAWNHTGTLMAATCRDKRLRIFDARSGRVEREASSHGGIKGSRVVWLGAEQRLVTTGFSRSSEREVWLWDSDTLKPISTVNVDMSAGMLMPFYDASTRMLYVAGKGDGNIRYYEYSDDKLYFLTEFQSPEPQRGLGAMPKRGVDVQRCEVMRFFKVASNSLVEPVSFRVPRKSESFQSDIYPPAHAGVAALTASEYFAGKSADPVLVDMEQIYRDGPLIAGTNTPISAPKVAPAPAAAAPKQQPAPSKPTQPAVSEPPAAQKPAVQPSESPAPDTSKLDSLHKELEQVRADLEKAQKATFDATAREHSTQEQLKQVQQQLADSQQSEKRLQAMVDSGVSADQLQAVESQLKSAVEDADSLRAELERASAQAESYKVQLAQASARASEHEQTSAGLQKDLQAAIQAANALALAAEKAADSL
ncbi:Coronin-like protein crn1 [Coemansia sp. RSA 990]|nr:hypothetical protein BX667DRAFT_494533 [Coemansia mojavensis]KAJ1741882.1 Coronin-like protein crn1 [Coemansia sp. RSA 1086]KAJ1750453.1 Coronin-like protein crn1 [Coemansia sp. RSA 1821]KAJ1872413.1 Coronin-like protein crn1 [Coemansia sp. RSA 990]KAJ2675328.1 Coronin-like protein crn1 [Coemansia sp. RSA 1085]